MPARLPYSYKYLRAKKKFPHVWCPGCGIGIVMGSIIRAIDSLGWELDDILMVSGIGCTSRMPVYVDFNTLHTTHGRALAFGQAKDLQAGNMLRTTMRFGKEKTVVDQGKLAHVPYQAFTGRPVSSMGRPAE